MSKITYRGYALDILKQGLHHVSHLDEKYPNLLVVVTTLYVELYDNTECADGNYGEY